MAETAIQEREEHAPNVITTDANSLLATITNAASDPNTDVEKMERLWSFYERITARQAEQAYGAAMNAAQKAIPHVAKNQRNTHTKSDYANLEAVSEAADPIIHQHGFSLSYGTDTSDLPNHYRITCDVTHADGHTKRFHADIPSDSAGAKGQSNKNATQAFGSTMTYGRRYLKCLIFDIKTGDRDDDGNRASGGDVISEDQLANLREQIEAANADVQRFCRHFRIEALPNLPAAKFEEAMRMLKAKQEKS